MTSTHCSHRSLFSSLHKVSGTYFRIASFCLVFMLPGILRAQGTSATVTGFVNDGSAATIPGATITLINVDTGVKAVSQTNSTGSYRIAGLLPGRYRSTITKDGFKTTIREGIELHLEDVVTLDYALEVGSVTESVTVSADTPLIEAQSPTISQVIEGRQVEDTPLNGRNVMNLVALTPGVVPQGATAGSASNNALGGFFTNAFGFNNYQIAGGLANHSSIYLDGAPLNMLDGHATAFVTTQDAIQEFRVESSLVNPQYGAFGGGVISFGVKSGTNTFHGSLYGYLRNTILNANNFINNETIVNGAPVPRPKFIQNQYGTTLGGPVLKEKAFFFFSYEGFRLAQGIPNAGLIPTPAELSGDFSKDAPIFDPATIKFIPGTNTPLSIQQFSCNGVANVICPARFDATANVMANVVRYWPTPNVTGNSSINYSHNGTADSSNNQYNTRVDYNLGSRQKLFGRYTYFNRNQAATQFLFGNNGPTSGASIGSTMQHFVIGDNVVLNSTSVLDLRAAYLRYFSFIQPAATNVDLSQFGPFWSAISNQLSAKEYPNVLVANTISQPFSNLNLTTTSPLNNLSLSGTFSKILGRHSLSLGGEIRHNEEYLNQNLAAPGLFVFAGTATACTTPLCLGPTGAPVTRITPGGGSTPIADFLTGTITAAPFGFNEVSYPSAVSKYGGLFANDTFQMSPRLTITAGLRYELPGGFTEKHDRNGVLLPQLANPLVLVNSSAYASRSDLQKHLTLFSPRVGMSFQPIAGTVVRAGYSLAYEAQDDVFTAGPFGSSINSPTTFVAPGSKLSQPLRGSTTIIQPLGRSYTGTQLFGQTISGRIPTSRFPYLQQWNANVQQTLGGSAVVQFAYLGARGDHLPIYNTIDINQLPDQYDGLSTAQITAMGGSPLGGSLRPYPMYQNVNAQSPFVGDTYYHSAQVTFNKRFNGGGTLLGNYTWSKFISTAESTNAQIEVHNTGVIQDYTNLRGERSLLSYDVPQRLVISYIYDLPFGKGKHFLANSGGVVNQVVSGWSAGGITTFQAGFPLAITATSNNLSNLYGAGVIRPNVVPGCNKRISGSLTSFAQTHSASLNRACFTQPGLLPNGTNNGTSFGNEPRVDGAIRGQGVDNWDFSVGKIVPVHDRLTFVFRAEVFNVANHVQFGDPNVASQSALFGQITSQANQPRLIQFSLRANY